MAFKPRFETLLKGVIAYQAHKTNTDKGADPFAKFVEKYVADGHKNIIIAGAIMAHVVRQLQVDTSHQLVEHQVPHALGGLTLVCATLSIYTTLAFMNRLRCKRASPTLVALWSQDAATWKSHAGYEVNSLLRLPFWWTAWAAAFAICYCVTRRLFPATCTDVEGLDTAMRLELKLGVISFIVGAVIHSLLAFRAFIQIGKPRIGS